ncbi:S41 family peptidase [Hazenella coriacea]|uniref:Carboxyl-terminal processing protease n=1 Tax=Hazenella coriacea TaxID=1179467 RepID=A0A4R3L7C8_9BACL|nr:S41 family peptidase [Hazenella coriacea]TCS95673.1 carboxyl-terminal processing protease [Hazenella coriacea]
MNFRGRTVAFIVAITMIFSSLGTAVIVGSGGILDQLSNGSLLSTSAPGPSSNYDDHSKKIEEAYNLIRSQYVRDVSDQKLIDGAIQGMVGALGDPHSAYMDPNQANQFKSDLQSSFTGIGAEVTMKNGRLTIVSPFKESPAEKAGIQPEDQVIKVNGESLEGMNVNEAVSKIRGPKGSKAKLEIVRPGVQDVLNITVIRDVIPLETVEAEMINNEIGRITVSQFSEDTATDFAKGLKNLEQKGMKGLVIDVRGNPGGLLPTVLKMCDELVPDNKVVLMTEDKSGKRTVYRAEGNKDSKSYPIAVLIDRGSASASEILAAALKEAGGHTLVGETTFGKGTVQSARDFSDGSNLKLTIAKWLTPKGTWIDQHGGTKGIKPDVPVKYPDYVTAVPPQPNQPLKRDQNSVEVKQLQIVLEALGYKTGRTDGYFDQQTELAVKAFQKTKNIAVTGQLDPKTADHLRESLNDLKRDPKNDVQLQVAIQVLKKKIQ